MNFDPQHFVGSLIPAAFLLWILYRRVRRNFGRQKLWPRWLVFRIALFAVISAFALIPTFFSRELALATVVGILAGAALTYWGAKHTRFEKVDGELRYIPHTYVGLIVTALFFGRVIYRITAGGHSYFSLFMMDNTPSADDVGGLGSLVSSPWTILLYFTYAAYQIGYYSYVLRESKHLKPEDMENAPVDKLGGNV